MLEDAIPHDDGDDDNDAALYCLLRLATTMFCIHPVILHAYPKFKCG